MEAAPAAEFDLADLAVDDPYPALAAVRAAAPVARLANGFWAITGYEAAMAVFRQRAFASGPIAGRYVEALPPGAARDEMSHRINFLDPPDHPRVRGLVSKAFTPRRVADLAPWMAATAERLLDAIGDEAAIDLLRRFAHQLPSLVISELLGVPSADRDRLTGWSDAVAPLLGLSMSDAERAGAVAAAEAFHAYLSALLDERRRRPGDDLLSALLAAEENGERLQRVELLSLAATLYSAGHRTTRDLFANGMSVLLRGGGFGEVVAGRWPVAAVVAEILRYETPTLFVVRIPVEPTTVGASPSAPSNRC
ncbi:MAG: cytochrome P450 [Candidatus Binatia bacterium]